MLGLSQSLMHIEAGPQALVCWGSTHRPSHGHAQKRGLRVNMHRLGGEVSVLWEWISVLWDWVWVVSE